MNARTPASVPAPVSIAILTTELIAESRAVASASRRRLIEVLEEKSALPPDAFVACLAAHAHLPVIRMDELRGATPLFDWISFTDCTERSCALMQSTSSGAVPVLVLDDPFDPTLQSWADEKIPVLYRCALVHRGDLVAFLAGHEESLRALDAVGARLGVVNGDDEYHEDLSLKSINDETSDVVRLVRSTLRDALRNGASDVHLETTSNGLTIKFRIDGILSQVKTLPTCNRRSKHWRA